MTPTIEKKNQTHQKGEQMGFFWSSRPEHNQRPPTDTAKLRFALIPTANRPKIAVSPPGAQSTPPLARGRSPALAARRAHRSARSRRCTKIKKLALARAAASLARSLARARSLSRSLACGDARSLALALARLRRSLSRARSRSPAALSLSRSPRTAPPRRRRRCRRCRRRGARPSSFA